MGLRGAVQTLLSEAAAQEHGIRLEVAKLPDARKGVELLPRRWVMERSFAWAAGVRRLGKGRERLSEAVAGQHVVAFAGQMLHRLVTAAAQSPQHALTGGEISLHVA